jgi:hypothetical protein
MGRAPHSAAALADCSGLTLRGLPLGRGPVDGGGNCGPAALQRSMNRSIESSSIRRRPPIRKASTSPRSICLLAVRSEARMRSANSRRVDPALRRGGSDGIEESDMEKRPSDPKIGKTPHPGILKGRKALRPALLTASQSTGSVFRGPVALTAPARRHARSAPKDGRYRLAVTR